MDKTVIPPTLPRPLVFAISMSASVDEFLSLGYIFIELELVLVLSGQYLCYFIYI